MSADGFDVLAALGVLQADVADVVVAPFDARRERQLLVDLERTLEATTADPAAIELIDLKVVGGIRQTCASRSTARMPSLASRRRSNERRRSSAMFRRPPWDRASRRRSRKRRCRWRARGFVRWDAIQRDSPTGSARAACRRAAANTSPRPIDAAGSRRAPRDRRKTSIRRPRPARLRRSEWTCRPPDAANRICRPPPRGTESRRVTVLMCAAPAMEKSPVSARYGPCDSRCGR